MNQRIVRLGSALALLFAAFGAGACIPFGDPEGPGAAGNISLGAGVVADGFTTLHVAAVPDDSQKAFDPKAPGFPGTLSSDESGWAPETEALAGMTFPHAYQSGEGLGTTKHEHWRLFVWLSKSSDETAPTSGEPYGTTTFKVDSCGSYGDYCAVTKGVDITIDKTAP
jgi:hypothetical protein